MMSDYKEERFVRWQGRSLEYFAYAINLSLGLSIGAIGFEMSLLQSPTFTPVEWQKCVLILSLFSLVVASGSGIACVFKRVSDFRNTTEITRKISNGNHGSELEDQRELVGRIGNRTRTLFSIQVWSFTIGIISLIFVMTSIYSVRYFRWKYKYKLICRNNFWY